MSAYILSLVIPGESFTMAILSPASALNRVDFPTFGLPTTATTGFPFFFAIFIEPLSTTPVLIEDNVFIGANAVIVEGVKIGKNSIVGAGAVVLEDVKEGMVVGGVPAKVIKKLDSSSRKKKEIIPSLRKLT